MTLDFPGVTPAHERLARRLQGTPEGLTRAQIATHLGVSDRVGRQLVEDLTVAAALPLVCDRGETGREEGRYRIARPDEIDRVNREIEELTSRGLSALKRAKGLRTAYQNAHHAGMFLANVPEAEAVR